MIGEDGPEPVYLCERHHVALLSNTDLLVHILFHMYGLEDAMTSAQDDINADTTIITALSGSLDAIISGIDALKAATDGTVDTSSLDSALADLKTKVGTASDDVAPAAPVEPEQPPAPADGSDQPAS